MEYRVEYAALCHKGLIRDKNQDNFWCSEVFLESENEGLTEMLVGDIETSTFPVFAVFDGMGGEQQGEVAAYIAARSFDTLYLKKEKSDVKKFLLDSCFEINRNICEYQQENRIRQMGTTGAILMFGQDDVFICNVGDSRIYQYSNKKLLQISKDHVESNIVDKKPPLTQNLGISETEFVIEPYIAKGMYSHGDRYLICSDGLTDMVSEDELLNVFAKKKSVSETVKNLMDMALRSGGVDNTTIILCEVCKKNRFFNWKKKER